MKLVLRRQVCSGFRMGGNLQMSNSFYLGLMTLEAGVKNLHNACGWPFCTITPPGFQYFVVFAVSRLID